MIRAHYGNFEEDLVHYFSCLTLFQLQYLLIACEIIGVIRINCDAQCFLTRQLQVFLSLPVLFRGDDYVSADEACRYITEELGLSETKAKKLVDKINKRHDGKIAKSDLEAIKDKIANA